MSLPTDPTTRLARIQQARQQAMAGASPVTNGLVAPWIEQSWQRCLAQGQRPDQPVHFNTVTAQTIRDTAELNQTLVQAARGVLQQLGRALAQTRYFAILTNQDGVVIDVDGPIDRKDRRAELITRIGVDLSERSVGTTAIGAALYEQQPVWLHRGEHFYAQTSVYSCAGAPLIGPDGRCVGMLDLTGIDAIERPELLHLVNFSARRIENELVLQRPHRLRLHLNWPGMPLDGESAGIITLDADGQLCAANRAARQLLPQLASPTTSVLHSRDLFALPFELLFDAAHHPDTLLEAPLWSGLRMQLRARWGHDQNPSAFPTGASRLRPLREVKDTLIRQAMETARGNVSQAAQALGISRATLYRKLRNTRP